MSFENKQDFRKFNELSEIDLKNLPESGIPSNHEENDELVSAREFVEHIITEGTKYPHDVRVDNLHTKEDLPSFYDETMFRKGQDFYNKNTLGVFLGCYLALFGGFAQPLGKILLMTNKSSTPVTAFKRYSGTIMHMCTWYESDFEPESKMWSSIAKVRKMHSSVSKQSQSRLNHRFTQYDMSVVILAFMGFPIVRSKMMGIYNASEDELKGFIHFWRVIGYLMGIENEFNICRDSVEETKEICTLLLQKDLIPKMKDGRVHFETLSKAFIGGMQAILPGLLYYGQTVDYLHRIIDSLSDDDSFRQVVPLRSTSKWNLISCVVTIMQYDFVKVLFNNLLYVLLWFLRVLPIFPCLKFGIKNARVRI